MSLAVRDHHVDKNVTMDLTQEEKAEVYPVEDVAGVIHSPGIPSYKTWRSEWSRLAGDDTTEHCRCHCEFLVEGSGPPSVYV